MTPTKNIPNSLIPEKNRDFLYLVKEKMEEVSWCHLELG